MAQPQIIMKALSLRRLLIQLSRAKENRIRELVGLPPLMSWYKQCCMAMSSSFREVVCRSFCPCCVRLPTFREFCCPKFSFGYRLCTDGEYPNDLIKSCMGFVFGLALSMGIFFFMCLQLEANYEFALGLSLLLGLVLSVGLAFSTAMRCLVLLALPNFCSSKGRSFLILYVMVLIVNHPVQNFSHNLNVLTDAATCGQNVALNETKKLIETAAAPLMAVIGGIKSMLGAIRRLTDDLRKAFKALGRAVKEIVSIMAKVFKWLANIVNICNHNMGEPYRKCKKAFEDGYEDCKDALWIFSFLCSVVRLVGKVCYIARIGELLCIIAAAIKDLIMEKIGPPIVDKIGDLRTMFYFNVTINYHYHYNMNQSRPYSEIRDAILKEIRVKLSVFDVIKAILDNVMPLTVLLVVVKALMYRRNFLNKDNYDNVYITRHIFMIDSKRMEMNKETIIPLKVRESFKYIKTFSFKMTEGEMKKLMKGFLFWCFAAFHATYYMLCDYGLYWILNLVRRHMDVRTRAAIPPHLKLHVHGQGPMADMYKAMIGVVEPVSDSGIDLDTSPCLPRPIEPNMTVYKTVISILILCFFLVTLEAYGLRMRHLVAACYYPHRERARAVWLYNHILLMRGSFVNFTRRQLTRKREDSNQIQKMSIRSRLAAQCPLLRPLFRLLGHRPIHCLSCALEGKSGDTTKFVFCDNCNSPYCNECFIDLGNVCTACMNPVDYGDDDVSVETDSSEEEEDKAIRVANLQSRKQEVIQKQHERRPSQIVRAFQAKFGVSFDKPPTGTESESTSEYDTEYQHKSNASDSDSDSDDDKSQNNVNFSNVSLRRRSRPPLKSRPYTLRRRMKRRDLVTLDIFETLD